MQLVELNFVRRKEERTLRSGLSEEKKIKENSEYSYRNTTKKSLDGSMGERTGRYQLFLLSLDHSKGIL